MANTTIATGTYPGSTYVHFYDLTLTTDSNIFLEVSNDTGTSSVYTPGMQFVTKTSYGSPIHLFAGSYIVKATYRSPTYAVMNVYIPSDSSYSSLTALTSGSFKASSYDNYYSLHLEASGNLFLEATGNSGTATIYDTQLNFIKNSGSTPIYLDAGDYIVHAQYSSPKNSALNTYIPIELTTPSPESQNIIGTTANDSLTGGAGNDFIDGIFGIDISIYSLSRSNYTVTKKGTGFTVKANAGIDGIDDLTNIERLQFSDTNVALDIDGNAGKVAKILASVFGASAVSNSEYAGIGLDLIDGGMSYEALSALAINAAGAHTKEAVVDLLWTNVMGSHPTAAEAKPFINMLAEDLSNVGSLGVIAADYAATIGVVNLTALSQTGLEYI